MAELCDRCSKPMIIKRNAKGSRYVACSDPACKSTKGAKKIAPKSAAQPAQVPNDKNDKPSRRPFALGW